MSPQTEIKQKQFIEYKAIFQRYCRIKEIIFLFLIRDDINLFTQVRNSKMLLNEVYFWTDTVKDWYRIFSDDKYKNIVLSTLKELVARKKIIVYAFVIMPNHLHLIWKLEELNGKELPHASFNKFTAHQIFQDLKLNNSPILQHFEVSDGERNYRLWQRDPLAILMDSIIKHLNPLQDRWQLCKRPEDYPWSSASFYETGYDEFGFLTDYRDEF